MVSLMRNVRPVGGMTQQRALEIAMAAMGVEGSQLDPVVAGNGEEFVEVRREDRDDMIRELIGYQGLTVGATAIRLNMRWEAVERRRQALGLQTVKTTGQPRNKGITRDMQARIRQSIHDMHSEGKSDAQMGRALGLSHDAVRSRRVRMGLPTNLPAGWKERHPHVFGEASVALNARLAELHAMGMDDEQMATAVGHTREAVRRRRIALKLPSNRPSGGSSRKNVERRALFKKLVDDGLTDQQIGEHFGFSRSDAARDRQRYGLPVNHVRPQQHTDRDVMSALVEQGLSAYKIGKQLGIDRSTAQRWIRRHGLTPNE